MQQPESCYLDLAHQPALSIVKGVDRDVEKGEDMLMLGYSLVLMAPLFAPIAPPKVLLPLMALVFLISVCTTRFHFHGIQRKFVAALDQAGNHDLSALRPITVVFKEHPQHTLADGFNPIKNWVRTLKSFLGGLMVNTLWMPVFYLLGMQFVEEKQLRQLNLAVMAVEQSIGIGTNGP